MKNKIVFFGGVGAPNEFGGELNKNKEIIARLEELNYDLVVLDTYKTRTNKKRLLRNVFLFFMYYLFCPKTTFIFSTSFGNIYFLIKVLYWLPINRNVIYWVIGGALADRIESGEFYAKYVKKINTFIVEGEGMRIKMHTMGFKNVIVVPNFKTIGQLPKIHKKDDGRIHFLFISRIMPDKGCRYIMQSVDILNKKGYEDKYVVDFYGGIDSSYKEEFECDVNRFDNVNFCGSLQMQYEYSYDVLATYHYMLFSTYWSGEGFPGVVVDAYKAGVPIIASDWNLNKEFIFEGETGFIIPPHSVEKLSEIMENAILNKYDNEALTINCQTKSMLFDTKNIITSQFIEGLIKL